MRTLRKCKPLFNYKKDIVVIYDQFYRTILSTVTDMVLYAKENISDVLWMRQP